MSWMNRGLGIAFLVVGIILLIFGVNAWQSAGSEISEALTGAPTNKAIWLLVGGVALTILGLYGTFFRKNQHV